MSPGWPPAPRRYGRRLGARAVYEAKTLISRDPTLAVRAARWRGHGEVVHPRTDLLIEAYPRSANSFAVAAFRLAQGRPVEVAHHTHAPGHVRAALALRIPALVLIREPEDSVLEFLIVRPDLTYRQALRGWLRFYGALLGHRDGFVVGPFEEVTSDFGGVIRRLNDRFGTAFTEFVHTRENVDEVFRQMNVYWTERTGVEGSIERFVGRPSEVRDRWKDEMRSAYRAMTPGALRSRARSLYLEFVRGASS